MREAGTKVLTWRTTDADVVRNQTITPKGQTNPAAPRVVYFGEGYEGFGYGDYCMIIEREKVSPLYPNEAAPGQYYTTSDIPAEEGSWTTIDQVKEALKK